MKQNHLNLWKPKYRKRLVMLSLIVLLFVVGVQVALATKTPKRCDEPEKKYGCSIVEYRDNGQGGWEIQNRQWQGAVNGGARQWQAFWTKDWEWNGSSWVFREKFGPSAWYDNIQMGTWRQWANDNRNRVRFTLVWHKFKYQDCTVNPCATWCSLIQEHSIWTNTSKNLAGPANCSP